VTVSRCHSTDVLQIEAEYHGQRLFDCSQRTVAKRNAGRSVLTWNGEIKRGFAPRGVYTATVSALTPSGASASAKATLRIT
jgi:hypothetical protein